MEKENKQEVENKKKREKGEDLVNELEKVKKELEKCCKEKEKYLNGWKRERADFLNYKKGENERIEKAKKLAQVETMRQLLDILDSFDRAEEQITQDLKDNPIIRGFLGIKQQIKDLIVKYHIQEIDIKEGMEFNPQFCEAVEIIETEDPEKDHKIAQVIAKGYLFENIILRPQKVKVFKKVEK